MNKEKDNNASPKGWIQTTLGEIVTIEYGKNLIGNERKGKKYAVWGSNGIIGNHDDFLVEGPVIIIGRKGSVGNVHFSLENCWPIDTTYFIKPTKSLNFFFLYYLLKFLNLADLDNSTTIPGLNRNHIYDKKIFLPSLIEQNQIVTKIEELFSNLENSNINLKRVQNQLKIYKQALLESAFKGYFTKDWRKQNSPISPEILFKQIEKEREKLFLDNLNAWKKGKIKEKPKRNKPLKKLTPTEILSLPEIPKNWKWIKIGEFEQLIASGSTPKGGKNIYPHEGIFFLRSQNIYPNKLELDNVVYIDEITHNKMKRTQLKEKDVLLNITGASIGRSAFIPEHHPTANVNQHVCIIRSFTLKINYKFLSTYLNSPNAQKIIGEINSGATREALNLDQIRNFPFPLLSLEEQEEIINLIESKLSLIDNLQSNVTNKLVSLKLLNKSILKKAFEGKLTPQISDNETTKALLEDVKNEIKIMQNEKLLNKKPVKAKIMKQKLIDILLEKFEKKPFTYEDLRNEVKIPYEDLRNQLFDLLEKGDRLKSSFNKEDEKINFNIIK